MRFVLPSATRAVLLLGCLAAISCGSESVDSEDILKPRDVKDVVQQDRFIEDEGTGQEVVIDDAVPDGTTVIGAIELQMYAPTACGCAANEIPPVNCGWYTGQKSTLRVKAGHTGAGYVGVSGVHQVKLLYMGDATKPQGIPLTITTQSDQFGYFSLELEVDRHLPKVPGTGVVDNRVYPFRVTVISKIKSEDGRALERSRDFELMVDTQGPLLSLVSPSATSGVVSKYVETFPVALLAQDQHSGLTQARFFFGEIEIQPSVTGLGGDTSLLPISRALDIRDFPTQSGMFRVEAEDCVGNRSVVSTEVDFIGTPKFEMPTKLSSAVVEKATKLRTVDIDAGDGLDDLLVIGTTGVGLARTSLSGGVGPVKRLVSVPGLIDAVIVDVDMDEFADIVALASVGEEKRLLVFMQLVDDEGNATFTFAAEPSESTAIDPRLTLMEVRDMNLDGRPDVVLVGPHDEICAAVMLHSGKDWQVPSVGKSFLAPKTLSGVTSISSMSFGNYNGDIYPDLVVGRTGSSFVTTLLNNGQGGLEIAHDTALYGAGSALVVATDLDDNGMDDVVMTSTLHNALYVAKGRGNGYFDALKAYVGQTIEEFGAANVANLIDLGAFSSGTRARGGILSLGSTPDSMVMVNLDASPEKDIAVALPEDNRIALYMAEPQSGGLFREGYFIQPGLSPRGLIAGRFNGDVFHDLAVIVGPAGDVMVLLNQGSKAPGLFHAPLEIPLPVQRTWTQGRVSPLHFEVRNMDNRPGTEIVVVTAPEKQEFAVEEGTLSLVLTFLSNGGLPSNQAIKSLTSPSLKGTVTGLTAGRFDTQDSCLDLAISYSSTPETPCAGRTFDILRGCRKVISMFEDVESLNGGNADVLVPQGSQQPGHFWALGGYLGLKKPSGILAARLDLDDLDDIILFAPESGSPTTPESYQLNTVGVYLTRFDRNWLSMPGGTSACPQQYDQTWFRCAPYWPLPQADGLCAQQGSGSEPPPCLPSTGDVNCDPTVHAAWTADRTGHDETGFDPVAAVAGNFYPDSNGCNDIMVAWKSGNVSYLRAACNVGAYSFHQTATKPHLFAVGYNPVDLKAADLDKDGHVDAVAALDGNLSVVYGLPGGNLFAPPQYLINLPDGELKPSSLNVSDVNEDGLLDILFTVKNTNQLAVFVSGGDRQFYGPFYLPTGAQPKESIVADLDGDGCLDVAVLNEASKSVTILKNLRCGPVP